MSNFLAIALALTGPRLWILVKAFGFSSLALFKRFKIRLAHSCALLSQTIPILPLSSQVFAPSDSTSNPLAQQIELQRVRPDGFGEERVEIMQRSHSELEAALALVANVWGVLRSGQIRLSNTQISCTTMRRVWRNFLSRLLDLIVSIFFSTIFVGIFVLGMSYLLHYSSRIHFG